MKGNRAALLKESVRRLYCLGQNPVDHMQLVNKSLEAHGETPAGRREVAFVSSIVRRDWHA